MPYKFVNADQLDADLTAIADAIRTKGGTPESLLFPAGMISAISAISTGVELTLKVAGGTARPAEPTQNMIWANTEHDITAYVFSATEPTTPVEGMLWIIISNSSVIETSIALEEEWLKLYFTNAKQYISGAWVDQTVKSYQNGAWVDWYIWDNYLYKTGDQYERITGGWRDGLAEGYWKAKDGNKMEFRSDCIFLFANDKSAVVAMTDEKIDLSDFSAIEITYLSGTIASLSYLFVSEDNINEAGTEVAILQMPASSAGKPQQLIISHLTGKYHVGIVAGRDSQHSASFYVAEIRLVK